MKSGIRKTGISNLGIGNSVNNRRDFDVAIVDDDDLMLSQVSLILETLGIENSHLIESGEELLLAIDSGSKFDLLIVDLNMPGIDGVEVIRGLAARNYAGALALFSGEDYRVLKTAECLAQAYELNVLGTLSKPVTPDQMGELLSKYDPADSRYTRPLVKPVRGDVLQEAVQKDRITPYFQPKLDRNKKIASAEVLARWQDNNQLFIPPIAFIPVAEDTGIIQELTLSVFKQSVAHFSRWLAMGYKFKLAVNISTENLKELTFPDQLEEIASKYHVSCDQIILELTESRLMENLVKGLDVLSRLRLKGFALSIDDFGTGYSSMEHLNRIPFNELKIDRAFVHDVHQDPAASAILESSTSLAKKLRMVTVAEGVETPEDWRSVVNVGCDLIQGFYRAKPMAPEQFESWLVTNSKVA
ncbi:EAL domain-containing response regulator [Aliikangiella marina]|nr:EAL domain-containing response regulator [Aliikangiella marina]